MWVSLSLLLCFPPACGYTFPGEGVCLQAGGERGKEEGEMEKKCVYVLGSTLRKWGVTPASVVKIGSKCFVCQKVPPALLDRRQRKEGGLFILRPLG